MRTIHIETIHHDQQRYETVGDYYEGFVYLPEDEPLRIIRVSEMQQPDYEFLVAFHELIESHLVNKRGIPAAAIDAFDISYEALREDDDSEPGDDPTAPYYREHQFATGMERLMAHELGVDWAEYERKINSL